MYESQLSGEAVHTSKHQAGLKVPLDHRLVLEVVCQMSPPVLVVLPVLGADVEGQPKPLQSLVWLHAQDLIRYVVARLQSQSFGGLASLVGESMYQFYEEVGDLLEEDHQSSRLLVVLGVSPDQTDGVEQRRELLLQLKIL